MTGTILLYKYLALVSTREDEGESESRPANQGWLAVRPPHASAKNKRRKKPFFLSLSFSPPGWGFSYYGATIKSTRPAALPLDDEREREWNQTCNCYIFSYPSHSLSHCMINDFEGEKNKEHFLFIFVLKEQIFFPPAFSTHENMDVDFILNKIGLKGCFPVGIYFYTLFMVCTYCWQMMAHDYGKWTPEFTCAVSLQ